MKLELETKPDKRDMGNQEMSTVILPETFSQFRQFYVEVMWKVMRGNFCAQWQKLVKQKTIG